MHEFPKNAVKAWARGYDAQPFYFVETSKSRKRITAWTGDSTQVKTTFHGLLSCFPDEVEVVLKIMFSLADDEPMWQKYRACVAQSNLVEAVQKNEPYIFSAGMNQLWIRNQETKDYFAFDEHGVFFIYSGSAVFPELLAGLGFQEKYEDPIYSRSHFHHRPSHLEYLEMKFVSALNLQKVSSDI
jgi:hypothetical protein